MPQTTIQTMTAPRPRDPRIPRLAKALGASRSDAFTAVADVWEPLSLEADDDGLVKGWTPDDLDALVDTLGDGCGRAMVEAGLVGVVDDGLVLPSALRRQLDHADGRARPVAVAAADVAEKTLRRRQANAVSARKSRRKAKVLKPKATSKPWRTLGWVAGHEVRAYDGQYGVYAMVMRAKLGGQPYRKLTAGDKSWALEDVTLVDVMPDIMDKWQAVHDQELKSWDPSRRRTLSPTYDELRNDWKRQSTLADIHDAAAGAADRRHDDASSRHDDASSSVIIPSSSNELAADEKSRQDETLDVAPASSSRHHDAPSSMSSKTSSSKEEDMYGQGKGSHDLQEWERKDLEARMLVWAEKCGRAIGLTADETIEELKADRDRLFSRLRSAGVDPRAELRPPRRPQLAAVPDDRRGTSLLEAAGIPPPDLRPDRLRPGVPGDVDVGDVDQDDDQLVRQAS